MIQLTDTVKHLILINVVMYFGTLFFMGEPTVSINQIQTLGQWNRYMLAMFYPESDFFSPYQIITHMFMHADIGHLFFNMFGLYMFGSALEMVWGGKKFLVFYVLCGIGALALYMLTKYIEIHYLQVPDVFMDIPMLGASGAVFGLLAGYGTLFPESRIMLLFPPIPMKAKYFVLIYGALELFLGVSGISSGIAHFAHVGGALVGFLLILYWKRTGKLHS